MCDVREAFADAVTAAIGETRITCQIGIIAPSSVAKAPLKSAIMIDTADR